jgi:hypothetical protein
MEPTIPNWLAIHGGRLARGANGSKCLVFLQDEPLYRLDTHPAEGRFACEIVHANSGRHIGSSKAFPSETEALQGGLERLREILGW